MSCDIAIIGAGMAGASLAAELAPHARVILIEAEDMPGYHATGRSAAFWTETYGGPAIQPLTTASFDFLDAPPADFSDHGFLRPRGAIHIADAEGRQALAEFAREFAGSGLSLEPLDRASLAGRIPGLRQEWQYGITEPRCTDIDVGGLHQAYLKAARRHGAELRCNARVVALARTSGGWSIATPSGTIGAQILVNAAGAWADEIAVMAGLRPIGIQPYRRTLLQLRVDPAIPADLPLVIDVLGRFYFKGESAGRIWLSPHDETPVEPSDAVPEEIDIAIAIDRLEKVVDWRIDAVERKWAGLRSFAPDRLPVYGFGPSADGFFWCAGQGGFGIQTAPAGAALCRSLILNMAPDPVLAGIDPDFYAPGRFAR